MYVCIYVRTYVSMYIYIYINSMSFQVFWADIERNHLKYDILSKTKQTHSNFKTVDLHDLSFI